MLQRGSDPRSVEQNRTEQNRTLYFDREVSVHIYKYIQSQDHMRNEEIRRRAMGLIVAPTKASLPPTNEALSENVAVAHLRVAI